MIYTNKVKGGAKLKMTPFILINPAHKGDKGLLAHEKLHVKQWWLMCLASSPLLLLTPWFFIVSIAFHDLLYTFIRQYRQWSEVACFKEQLKHGGSIEYAAKFLSENYDLKITHEEALKLLC